MNLNQMELMKDMKEYYKVIKAVEKDRPKLHPLILQHLSDGSLEEMKAPMIGIPSSKRRTQQCCGMSLRA